MNITVEVEPREPKRLETNRISKDAVSLYQLKRHTLRKMLNQLEVDELKSLCRFLNERRGGTKAQIVNRLIKSEKIKSLGFVSQLTR